MCDCKIKINEELSKDNTRLSPMIQILIDGGIRVYTMVATERIDTKKRVGPIRLAAAYCPFCGEKVDL